MGQIRKIRQLALAHQRVLGTAETLAATDVREASDCSWNPQVGRFQNDPHRATYGRRKSQVGLKGGGWGYKTKIRGSGSATTAPDWFEDLGLAGFRQERAFSLAIGAITQGPIPALCTVTGGTSMATGLVLFQTATGAAAIYFIPLTGTFQNAETLTFSGSSATCTTGGTPAALGVVARPWTPRRVKQITIGAITGGPFLEGERITGGTSSAKGRVRRRTVTGTTTLYFDTLSGTFTNGETLTGESSGATAAAGSAPSDTADILQCVSGTAAVYEGNIARKVRDARSKVKLSFTNSEPAFAEFELMGVYEGVTDAGLFTSSVPTVPNESPVFNGVGLLIGSYSPIFRTLSIDMGMGVEMEEDANSANGLRQAFNTAREPSLTIDPLTTAEATHPWIADWLGDVVRAYDFSYGSSAGNRFRVLINEVQPTEMPEGERNSQTTHQLTGQINDSTDSDLDIIILSY
ncbi:MAG TPA: hypothetical protein VEL28_21060 [Candidatus Binatia bacterium]|nr:hypothetical protein [Candidatus Binatia bacterium]